MANTTTLSQKFQVVVPKEVREKMNLKKGMRVYMYPVDDYHAILVKKPEDYVEALKGLGKEVWDSLGGADNYIKEERASWNS